MNSEVNLPLISFIVPVYNAAPYLAKCLQSIENQTLENIEVLLIDDGSTDNSLDLCADFAIKNNKFQVFSKPNEGGAVARNFGFEKSIGKYICYIDPDDWIEPSMCKDVIEVLNSTNADFANFGIDFISCDGKVVKAIYEFGIDELPGSELVKNSLLDRLILSSPNNKVYLRSFLERHKIRFPPIRGFEDLPYTRAVSLYANKAAFVSRVYYHALVREGSLTREMSLNYIEVARTALLIERDILFKGDSGKGYCQLYKAHVVKLFTSLLIRSAFRVLSYGEYRRCFSVASDCDYYTYSSEGDVIRLLGFRYYLFTSLCRHPMLLRGAAIFAKLLKFRLY